MYPTIFPGTSWPGNAGGFPNTVMCPREIFSVPTMHFRSVVFPHPLGPIKSVFLEGLYKLYIICFQSRQVQKTRGLSFQSDAQTHRRSMLRYYEWKLSLPLTYSQAWEEFVGSKYCLCKLLKITRWSYKIKHNRVCRQRNKMLLRHPRV